MSNEYENNKPCFDNTCPAIGFQDVSVCVPVEVKPFADVGKVRTKCLGDAVIESRKECKECKECGDHEDDKDFHKHTCNFTISQKIRVEVPVVFGAKTEVGKACIDCKCAEVKTPIFDCYSKNCNKF